MGEIRKEPLISYEVFYLKSPAFTTLTAGMKLIISGIMYVTNLCEPAMYYFGASGLIDFGEVLYRCSISGEFKDPISWKDKEPFSFFEKHLIYDLPKYLIRKIKGRKNPRELSDIVTD